MPKIVQFLHTAVEASPSALEENEIPWNNHMDHRRKFILSEGSFIDKNNIVEDQLTFWGEWEAQSKIERLNESRKHLPKFLNRPFIDPGVPNRTHNTDPYVFGKSFRYIVCKQGHFELLRKLEPFSLILFGSSINN